MTQKWYQKASVQGAFVSGCFLVVFLTVPQLFKIPALRDKILQLESENNNKTAEIQRLETQLTPFKTIALERFTGSESERLKRLAQEMQDIKKDIVALRDYSDVAFLSATGKPFEVGKHLSFHTPLSKILEGTYEIENNDKMTLKIDNEAEAKYRESIEKFPRFPFAYYGMVLCLKNRGDEGWRDYAKEAVKILENTTLLKGHRKAHDEVLQNLYIYLNENQ